MRRVLVILLAMVVWPGWASAQDLPGDDELVIPQDTGLVMVTCFVKGAELRVDGVLVASLPMTEPVSIEAGEHLVEVNAWGYLTSSAKVTIEGGKKRAFKIVLASDQVSVAEERDLCQEVECPENSTCIIEGGSPDCVCYQGYVADTSWGLRCTQEYVDPCAGETCPDGGECKVVDGTAMCEPVEKDEPQEPLAEDATCSDNDDCSGLDVCYQGQCMKRQIARGGKVLIAGGYIHLFFTLVNIGIVIGDAVGNGCFMGFCMIMGPFAGAHAIVSGFLLGFGYKYRKLWKAMPRETQGGVVDGPVYSEKQLARYGSQWLPLIISGYSALAIGIAGFAIYGGLNSMWPRDDSLETFAVVALSLGPIMTAAGIPLIAVGHTYQVRWKRSQSEETAAGLMPFVSPVEGGAAVGIAGYF
jgi:hypothetical protein